MAFLLTLCLALLQDPPPPEPPATPPDPFVGKVSDMVRSRLAAHVSRLTGPKVKFEDAAAGAAALEETIVQEAADKLRTTADEVRAAWKKREKKPRKLTFGDGSWIPLGGQDGGLDSPLMGRPAGTGELIPGGPSILTRRKPPPPPEPVPLGKPIPAKDQWWAGATSGERAAFVEGTFVRTSSMVDRKEDSKKCPTCNAKGTLNVRRGGIGLTVVCSRCHGAKDDLLLVYE